MFSSEHRFSRHHKHFHEYWFFRATTSSNFFLLSLVMRSLTKTEALFPTNPSHSVESRTFFAAARTQFFSDCCANLIITFFSSGCAVDTLWHASISVLFRYTWTELPSLLMISLSRLDGQPHINYNIGSLIVLDISLPYSWKGRLYAAYDVLSSNKKGVISIDLRYAVWFFLIKTRHEWHRAPSKQLFFETTLVRCSIRNNSR